MLVKFISAKDLPSHIACDFDFSNLWWSEQKNNKHYASLKRNKKYTVGKIRDINGNIVGEWEM